MNEVRKLCSHDKLSQVRLKSFIHDIKLHANINKADCKHQHQQQLLILDWPCVKKIIF